MIAQDFALYVLPESVLRGKYEVCMNIQSRLDDYGGMWLVEPGAWKT